MQVPRHSSVERFVIILDTARQDTVEYNAPFQLNTVTNLNKLKTSQMRGIHLYDCVIYQSTRNKTIINNYFIIALRLM